MTQETVMALLEAANVSGGLRKIGVKEEDLKLLAERAFKDVCLLTSPRETDEDDLLALLKRAL
jgi:alcohol dehydrogenase class IV